MRTWQIVTSWGTKLADKHIMRMPYLDEQGIDVLAVQVFLQLLLHICCCWFRHGGTPTHKERVDYVFSYMSTQDISPVGAIIRLTVAMALLK